MPVLYCLTPLPSLFLHYYDKSCHNESVPNNNANTMLDALFAGRRRPQCAPAVTSTPTTSPYSSEQLMGMYSRESLTPVDGVYLPSRTSYTPGEARKSLLAYIDSDNYAYADAERFRPKSIVLRREGPGEQVVATGTTVEAARAPDRNRTAKPRKSESKPGFLASVWALGRYFTDSTVSSTREVINDVVTLAAGFKREKRSYAASVGSSANGDDFIVDDEEGGLSESENERAALDKGKSREEVEEDLAGPSNRSYRSYSSSIITELDTVILTKEDLDANPELDGMPPVDDRPALERHQSKSQSELRPDPEVPRRSPSVTELKEAEKDARQEDIKNMLRDAVNAAEALKAAPGPVIVDELPASEEAKVQEPAIEPETTEVPPETPPKSPLRQRSPSVSSVGGLAKAAKEEEGEPKVEAAIAEVADKAVESAEVKAEEAPSTDLQDYSKAMTDRILNPSPPNASHDVPESPAVTESVTLPPVTEVVPEEEAAKPVPVSKASSRIEIDSEYAASSATAKPSSKIEVDSQYAASSTMVKPSSKIEVDSQYAASTATSKPEAGPVETKFTEGSSEETPKKAASITGTKPGLERRLSNAFRRDSVRRSLSVFSKKDKKDKNTPEWPSPATVIAAELTPPPTPPMTEDQVSIIERPKSRMSIFSLTKKDKKKKAASADADADSSDAAKSSTESAATPVPQAPAPKPALQKKPSFISVADSYKSSRPGTSQGPLSPVKEGDSEIPKPPQRRPTFRRPFSSDGDRKSRTQSWFANRKLKFNEKGEPVDPGNDEEGISTPTSPVVDSIQPTPRGSNEVPATPAKEDKAKFFRRQSISLSKKPTFGLARDRSMSASAVTVNSAATAPAGPQAPSPTSSDAAETPTKVKGAARLKGLVRSNTFMSTFGKKKEKEKSKGKGKEVATE
jgi:hypothetical protein